MLIIRTMPYSLEEMVQIISIRAQTECGWLTISKTRQRERVESLRPLTLKESRHRGLLKAGAASSTTHY